MRIANKEKNFSYPFEARLKALEEDGNASDSEQLAAINTYERLLTAKAIVKDFEGDNGNDTALLISVFEELCAEAHSLSVVED
ncbi:TPA: hypothetical protein OTZ20_002929 [Pseudomonas aeruginosa]|nr:hypothetical protein [Pseudomonas aeruginosa]